MKVMLQMTTHLLMGVIPVGVWIERWVPRQAFVGEGCCDSILPLNQLSLAPGKVSLLPAVLPLLLEKDPEVARIPLVPGKLDWRLWPFVVLELLWFPEERQDATAQLPLSVKRFPILINSERDVMRHLLRRQ